MACFVCGGTGEFYSLGLDEYRALVRAAVEEASGQLPIVAGVGYGTRLAVEFARAAAGGLRRWPDGDAALSAAGRAGGAVFTLPGDRRGHKPGRHPLPGRDNAIFTPATVARLAEIPSTSSASRMGRWRYGSGCCAFAWRWASAWCPSTACPRPSCRRPPFLGLGARSYSSAVFNFVPEIAWAFNRAAVDGDLATRDRLLEGFYRPFAELRDRVRGYAVALIKAGVGISTGHWPACCARRCSTPHPSIWRSRWTIVERGLALVTTADKVTRQAIGDTLRLRFTFYVLRFGSLCLALLLLKSCLCTYAPWIR